jgi:hypothetical protein
MDIYGHIRDILGHIRTCMDIFGTYQGHIRSHKDMYGHIRSYSGHIRSHEDIMDI